MNANLEDEQEIIWLHPPERYSYLRERVSGFAQRRVFPKHALPGGAEQRPSGAHLVAYTVLKQEAPSQDGRFFRRFWWVKKFDRFDGHGTDKDGDYYDTGGPVEAVIPSSVQAGKSSTPGWNP